MGDAEQGAAGGFVAADSFETFFLKGLISHGQHFVDDQNIGFGRDGHGKCQPHDHAHGVSADGLADEVTDVGEGDDVVREFGGAPAAEAEQRGVEA